MNIGIRVTSRFLDELPQLLSKRVLNKAARELNTTEYLLRKRLRDGKEESDSQGCYSTSQLTRVIYGSLHTEQLRRTREQAVYLRLENSFRFCSR